MRNLTNIPPFPHFIELKIIYYSTCFHYLGPWFSSNTLLKMSLLVTIHILRAMIHWLQIDITKEKREYSGFAEYSHSFPWPFPIFSKQYDFAIVTGESVPVHIHFRLQRLYLSTHVPKDALMFATCSISRNSQIMWDHF